MPAIPPVAPKSRAPSIAILVTPDRDGMPLYRQLYRQLRDLIVDGRLAPGARLPSARVMATDLAVSRNTVEAAIDRLSAEGLLVRRVGVGTMVLDPADAVPFARRQRQHKPIATTGALVDAPIARLSTLGGLLRHGGRIELDSDQHMGACTIDVQRFPMRTWNALMTRTMRVQARRALQSGDPQGDAALRQAISDHARLTRGVQSTAQQVVVLNSTQQAIDLAARLLLGPGDEALVEEPGYLSARAVLAATGATVRGIAVDSDGVQVRQFHEHPRARLLYCTPSHQFPLGYTLELTRRTAVLEWAARANAWILEDDYDCEFRYDGRPISALQGLDSHGRVLYIGTFNKVLFPGLRVAYAIVPSALVDAFVCARRLTDGGPPALVQATLSAFLREGHFVAHLRRARSAYASRRDYLVRRLREQLGDQVTIGAHDTGLHLTVHLPVGTDDQSLAQAGAGFGLGVAALSRYYVEWADRLSVPRGLLISYGGAAETAIDASLSAMAAARRQHASSA
jgi:GntR family transcriptional regulator / MocR family aminotransferase